MKISNRVKKFKVASEFAGERLDKFLAVKVKTNRSQVQKLIKGKGAFVNGKEATPGHGLKVGDLVEIKEIKKAETASIANPNANEVKPGSSSPALKIVAETDEYLVINKPAGLVMHGENYRTNTTLASQLLEYYPKIKKVGEDPERPGIVHRLDKEVSGLIVVAKTQSAFKNLKKQFQDRTIIKEYTALVYGRVDKDEDEILFPIRRSLQSQRMAALPVSEGKELEEGTRDAITQFKIAKRFINYTLLKVRIKTGRTHQIRVHLLAYGHPLVGDDLYSTKKTREKNRKINLGRVFLVSDRLTFKDLAGEQKTFRLGLPEDLKEFFKEVK